MLHVSSTLNTIKNITIGKLAGTVTDPNRKIRMIAKLTTQNITIGITWHCHRPKTEEIKNDSHTKYI